jgi:hypothetical protein
MKKIKVYYKTDGSFMSPFVTWFVNHEPDTLVVELAGGATAYFPMSNVERWEVGE